MGRVGSVARGRGGVDVAADQSMLGRRDGSGEGKREGEDAAEEGLVVRDGVKGERRRYAAERGWASGSGRGGGRWVAQGGAGRGVEAGCGLGGG